MHLQKLAGLFSYLKEWRVGRKRTLLPHAQMKSLTHLDVFEWIHA
jgi:hypothetical protein